MTAAMAVRGLLYKEWIKLRYLGLAPFALLLIGLGGSYYDMHGMKSANGGQPVWRMVMFQAHMPFKPMQYLMLLSGVWLAAVQFAPECLNRRLRLFFHLPVGEHRALFLIAGSGAALLAALSALLCLGQGWITAQFMPGQAARMAMLTLLPWCLAGFVSYAATALVLIESAPLRRAWHAAIGAVFALALCRAEGYGEYLSALPWFGLIVIAWFAALSGVLDRVKRGSP